MFYIEFVLFIFSSSEHVHQYMTFVRTVLNEAEQANEYAAHLCATSRNMMELFHVIYASLHERKAQEFPYLTGKCVHVQQCSFD
jgi:hypothetical protein